MSLGLSKNVFLFERGFSIDGEVDRVIPGIPGLVRCSVMISRKECQNIDDSRRNSFLKSFGTALKKVWSLGNKKRNPPYCPHERVWRARFEAKKGALGVDRMLQCLRDAGGRSLSKISDDRAKEI